MRYLFADVETYYDDTYTLRKMTPIEYTLDPRFEAIGCAFKWGIDGEPFWVPGEELQAFFDSVDTSDTALVTFNALFDAVVFAWRFKFIPKLLIDAMGVARAKLGHKLKSLALSSVARELGLGAKGTTVHDVKGMSAAAIRAAGLYDAYTSYSINDVELCAGVFKTLVIDGGFPAEELVVLDMVLRCAVEPTLHLDGAALAEHLAQIKASKEDLMRRATEAGAVDRSSLMSNERFAALLRERGVDPPVKTSPTTGKEVFAFAKTDSAMVALSEHEDPDVQALVAARLGHKSTIEETRTERFLKIWSLPFGVTGNPFPVPLRYAGAHTHRLSGDWKLNCQNLPSRGGKNAIRRAIIAPPNHKVVACDEAQIEARLAAWFCGQDDLVKQFADGEDVYSSFASEVFGFEVTKKNNPAERFIGKTAVLGLQYGLGWSKFQQTVKTQSREQTGQQIALSDAEAERVITVYRTKYWKITAMRRQLDNAINVLAFGGELTIGPCVFRKGEIILPNGLTLRYHNLHKTKFGEWMYEYGGVPKKLYGGSLLENIIQALARIVVMQAAVRLRKPLGAMGIHLALQVHDELVYVVPDAEVGEVTELVIREMAREPAWAPGAPLAAEAATGQSFGDCK